MPLWGRPALCAASTAPWTLWRSISASPPRNAEQNKREEDGMPIFAPVGEYEVTRAIVGGFMRQFEQYARSDVIIVGAGPPGPIAGGGRLRKGGGGPLCRRWPTCLFQGHRRLLRCRGQVSQPDHV